MNRNHFLRNIGRGSLALGVSPLVSFNRQDGEKMDPKVVQEFVGACHRDMDKVKTLLEEYPTLLNAAHDWKKGDFETGLGAASHVGYKELAQFLLDEGAQANIFTACLFGKMDIVKPMLTAFPKSLNALGPHGFTLLHHAEKGGDEALEVKEYLLSLGAKETKVALY
ncbi:ankyrin repeat domain-containing protein [Flavobacteriaceae bacterium TP-CH-4]|uniref:Ankyrin repeat domain-containing protein n=1 Tax=Pelagihabitans pacificus TaxID=2696054 RepID=A0A967AT58_9FLAO|nr:ankyrin repeat domain-containing protein [Pelagihabitans pacificus]NHF59813.1 ankyrin repeat domain-containing protein [Pelagihabitans pacificus]